MAKRTKRPLCIAVVSDVAGAVYVTDTAAVRGVATGRVVEHARACVAVVRAARVETTQDCPAADAVRVPSSTETA